ncbi:unnamed protein product [Clavelina lepadiformis]|uniref:Uncharacterized protein n=1 Tax=Clavelina lepadiformis TaxID=159417 RepID=A0ABP0GH97_CLALP
MHSPKTSPQSQRFQNESPTGNLAPNPAEKKQIQVQRHFPSVPCKHSQENGLRLNAAAESGATNLNKDCFMVNLRLKGVLAND